MNRPATATGAGPVQRHPPLLPGRYYHILNRGNNRENLFLEERNYLYFLNLYAKHVSPLVDTFAYCLLRNHFHLLLRVKELERSERLERSDRLDRLDPVTRAFTSMFQAYSMAINKAYGRTGKLFQEHFGRIEVTSNEYFTNLIFYIHFNPQEHGFVTDFRDWPWSSYSAFLSQQTTRLQRDEVLAWFSGSDEFVKFHGGSVDEKRIAPLITGDFE